MSAIDGTRSIRKLCERPGRSCRKKILHDVQILPFPLSLFFSCNESFISRKKVSTLDLVVVVVRCLRGQKIGNGNYFGCKRMNEKWNIKRIDFDGFQKLFRGSCILWHVITFEQRTWIVSRLLLNRFSWIVYDSRLPSLLDSCKLVIILC